MKNLKSINKQEILKFLVGGGTAVIVDFFTYKIFMMLGLERTIAKTLSFICGSILSRPLSNIVIVPQNLTIFYIIIMRLFTSLIQLRN